MYFEKTISIWVLRIVIAVIDEMKEFKDELEPITRHHIVEKGGFQQRICTPVLVVFQLSFYSCQKVGGNDLFYFSNRHLSTFEKVNEEVKLSLLVDTEQCTGWFGL